MNFKHSCSNSARIFFAYTNSTRMFSESMSASDTVPVWFTKRRLPRPTLSSNSKKEDNCRAHPYEISLFGCLNELSCLSRWLLSPLFVLYCSLLYGLCPACSGVPLFVSCLIVEAGRMLLNG